MQISDLPVNGLETDVTVSLSATDGVKTGRELECELYSITQLQLYMNYL